MANRRLISRLVIDTDRFAMMSLSARYLYFELAVRADDDGFLGAPMRVVRMVGCEESDLEELERNEYVIKFKTGVIVIRDWNVHNTIRKDMYKETIYQKERDMLCVINGRYYLKSESMDNVTDSVTCDVTDNVTDSVTCDVTDNVTLNKDKKSKGKRSKDNLFTSLTLKEGGTLPPSADAGGASTFTLTDCQECAEKGKVNLSDDGIKAFYDRMEKDGWRIKGSLVEDLLLAMRGFAKNHKQHQKQATDPQENKPPKKILKSFKSWLKYNGYDSNYENGFGEFDEEIAIDEEMIQIVWSVDDLSESMQSINERLTDSGYSQGEIKMLMQLFFKWSKEKK